MIETQLCGQTRQSTLGDRQGRCQSEASFVPHPVLQHGCKDAKKEIYSKCLSYQGGLKYHQIMWLVPNKTVPHPTQRVPNTNRAR